MIVGNCCLLGAAVTNAHKWGSLTHTRNVLCPFLDAGYLKSKLEGHAFLGEFREEYLYTSSQFLMISCSPEHFFSYRCIMPNPCFGFCVECVSNCLCAQVSLFYTKIWVVELEFTLIEYVLLLFTFSRVIFPNKGHIHRYWVLGFLVKDTI